ncbi:MAG TPA: hypothetical protein VJ777_12200 [Mycobacterium sp.]|nr:hypothetical protein [Mycobacterium sp.]
MDLGRGQCSAADARPPCPSLDLFGSGSDATPAGEVKLSSYAQRIASAMKDVDAPMTLERHCRGGMAAAAELVRGIPEAAGLCAFLPIDGNSLGALNAPDDSKVSLRTELTPDRPERGPLPAHRAQLHRLHRRPRGHSRAAAADVGALTLPTGSLELSTGHLPFLSDPWRLAQAIHELMDDLPH